MRQPLPAVQLSERHHKWVYPSYGWRCWGWNGAGVGAVAGGWRSTSLRERDCLALEEPWRRDECRSTRALSLRVTFLLEGGKVGIRVRETRKDGTGRRGGTNRTTREEVSKTEIRKNTMSVESERERIKSSSQERSLKRIKKINRVSHICMSNSMHTVGDNQIHTPS